MILSELITETYVKPEINSGEDYQLADGAESFVFTCLLNHHELPEVHPSNCCFTVDDLAKQVPKDKLEGIWQETLEKFPPKH